LITGNLFCLKKSSEEIERYPEIAHEDVFSYDHK